MNPAHAEARAELVLEKPILAPFGVTVANEAQALLDMAASQEQVETERLCAFARACLEMLETGRLALAVLYGGLFASRRALELGSHVLRDAERHAAGNNDADAIKETVA